MQTYVVRLQSEIPLTYRTQKAVDSVNLDIAEKSVHELKITADIDTPFNVGAIVGASGSGKTTLAKKLWGEQALACDQVDLAKPIIEQFPEDMSYDECVDALTGVGLTSVPCWVRPLYTLSNGQRARAEAALRLSRAGDEIVVFDEWTSTVDRTVAQVMSHRLQKISRGKKKRIVVLSCHNDVVPWLDPDWVIDCSTAEFSKKKALGGNSISISPSARSPRGDISASITI